MEIIYVWIEKFRNINKCGFHLNKNFQVEVKECGHLDSKEVCELSAENHLRNIERVEQRMAPEKLSFSRLPREKDRQADIPTLNLSITYNKKDTSLDLYGKNISSISAIVGKNSVGKTNFLTCIGDLYSSLDESSFIIIYFDSERNEYIVECNQVSIRFNGLLINAVKGSFQPETTVKRINLENEIFECEEPFVEYITVSENVSDNMYPDSNNACYYIPRFGLNYNRSSIYYSFQYLKSELSRERFNNNEIEISFLIESNKWKKLSEKPISIIPYVYPGKKHYFDAPEEGDPLYKRVFMLRLLECLINSYRFTDHDLVSDEIEALKAIIDKCDNNVEALLENYELIKSSIVNIRLKLQNNNFENTVDMELCYGDFVRTLENLIESLEEINFKRSNEISIKMKGFKCKNCLEIMDQLFLLLEKSDVDIEFGNVLVISLSNVSDGLKYYLMLFSSLRTCMYRNNKLDFRNVILLLDEPEARFHPELARNFILELVRFIGEYFSKIKFQIIVSTHSPFILSDLTQDKILVLEKDRVGHTTVDTMKIATFGADIHYLLKDAFFIEMTMGSYSRKQIREIIDKIKPDRDGRYPTLDDYEIRYLNERIEIIGEEIIRNKLLRMLDECVCHEDRVKHTKASLKRQIEKLQMKIDMLEV